MSSLRHNGFVAIGSGQDAYLDAARDCILDVGWRRTTLTEVARRAGVSRMTIYRAWPDMERLLGDLMTREWGQVIEASATDDFVERLVATVHALRDNELFLRIVELDPELLLPYLLHRRGRSQDSLLGLIEGGILRGQADGLVREGDPRTMSRALVLAAHGFVLSSHTMVDDDVSEADLDAELRAIVVRAMRP